MFFTSVLKFEGRTQKWVDEGGILFGLKQSKSCHGVPVAARLGQHMAPQGPSHAVQLVGVAHLGEESL